MRIVYNDPGFGNTVRAYFEAKDLPYNICVYNDSNELLAGCGFSEVLNKETKAFILRAKLNWASREFYSELLKYPFEKLGAEKVIAIVKENKKSRNVCVHLGGVNDGTGHKFLFTKEKALKDAERILKNE